MRTVKLPITASFLCEGSLLIAVLVKTENARIAVTVGNKDGAVRSKNRSREAPLVRSLKPGFRGEL